MKCHLNDISVHYEVYGTGKPIIMLHGYSLDSQVMKGCMEPIFKDHSNDYQRIYLDFPGMGQTEAKDWIKNSDQMLEIVLEFIDKVIPNQNFLIVGQSYGGYISRGVLKERTTMIDGMMLICPLIIPDKDKRNLPEHKVIYKNKKFIEEFKTNKYFEEFQTLAVVQDTYHFERFKNEILAGVHLANTEFIEKLKDEGYGFSFEVDHLVESYEKPVLILLGKQDSFTGYRDAFHLMENYPRGSFVVLDRAGHNLQIEQNKLFNSFVEEWLNRVNEG
ncbi:alpha/beta fold hydrolase [Chengkuizengella marina]|uniref:Alpha/beta hydrolase n=1 Tax=Chengkuizengella marina TaxID=2507566 RepID=A0A6N9PX48_9BACL|nr:alpha/beta hydrolase [Chengkuizengella marina]NBI27486.1 alpha/beta hydrolase [Chengkuizengella marina]